MAALRCRRHPESSCHLGRRLVSVILANARHVRHIAVSGSGASSSRRANPSELSVTDHFKSVGVLVSLSSLALYAWGPTMFNNAGEL